MRQQRLLFLLLIGQVDNNSESCFPCVKLVSFCFCYLKMSPLFLQGALPTRCIFFFFTIAQKGQNQIDTGPASGWVVFFSFSPLEASGLPAAAPGNRQSLTSSIKVHKQVRRRGIERAMSNSGSRHRANSSGTHQQTVSPAQEVGFQD